MKIEKIKIDNKVLDYNFLFYLFLKELNSTNKLNNNEINEILNFYYLNTDAEYLIIIKYLKNIANSIKSQIKQDNFLNIISRITNKNILILFIFSLELIKIKPLLLAEADIYSTNLFVNKKGLNQLSLQYDNLNKDFPYYKRVSCALLSLIFFDKIEKGKLNFMSEDSIKYLNNIKLKYDLLKKIGIEANQIFMLMFIESVNQSIKSTAGSSYENRVKNVLISMGLKDSDIKKIHDENDKSTEYDFFFTYNNRKYRIGAKRTLRERYKQFIKTSLSTDIDVMIEITLGLDLTEEKLNTIKKHNVYLFVADEVYQNELFMQNNKYVYPASELNLKTLEKL